MIPEGRKKIFDWLAAGLGLMGLLLLLFGMGRSILVYDRSGSVDFRNRVVAARQAELGLNPYLFKWNPSYPETLLDPSEERSDAKYTRMTSPPTVLWIHSLFADLPWLTQKWWNFLLNWFAFLLIPAVIFFGLRKKLKNRTPLLASLVLGSGVMAVSGVWAFHLERGQQYSFLTLALTLAVFTHSNTSRFFSALSVVFRQTLGFTLFLSFREKRVIRSVLLITGVGVIAVLPTLLKYPFHLWLDYLASAKDWYLRYSESHERIPPVAFNFPLIIEGDPVIRGVINFGGPGNIIHHYAVKMGLGVFPYSIRMLSVLFASLITGWKLWKNRTESLEIFSLRFFSSVYFVDILLPSPRSAYNGVFFFPVLLLSIHSVLNMKKLNQIDLFSLIVAAGATVSLGSLMSPYSVPFLTEGCYLVASVGFLLRKTAKA